MDKKINPKMNYGIILSRLDSTRLPRKALLKLGEKRLIDWCIDTLKEIEDIKIVLATTSRKIDDPLEKVAEEKEISIFRGDSDNVAKRVLDCIGSFDIKNFARINVDGPFVRSDLLHEGFARINEFDMVTNLVPRHYPYGMSVEILNSNFYIKHFKKFNKQSHLEHITSYFYENMDKFNTFFIKNNRFNYHDVRLTVDTKEDLDFLNIFLKKFPGIQNKTIEEIAESYKKMKKLLKNIHD